MIDTAKTASKIIQNCLWKNGYLKPFVKTWIDDGIPDWSLTDVKKKEDQEKLIVRISK